ncbi:hypothetical protein [Hymenobacter sp. 102]|uniref:hypothetical protein n=1 Tax=Hymenobacter sp. 102 TaxID=3403152 RepID=UPI003CF94A8E
MEQQRGLVQVLERAQAFAPALGFAPQGQRREQAVEEVEHVVRSGALQGLGEDQQRGQPAFLAHAHQRLCPSQLGMAGQARQPGFG